MTPAGAAPATGGSPGPAGIEAKIQAVMSRMTLAEKVGQMFVCNVYGDTATTEAPSYVAANHALYGDDVDNGADLIAKYHLGGVIYFAWTDSLKSPQQTAALSNGLQSAATSGSPAIPLQISTDQEGGIVTRIGSPGAVSPGNMAIGATFDPDNARAAASVTGAELRAQGISVDDAPVVDVNTNPQNAADGPRSFGDDPATVSRFAAAAVDGYQHAGVAAQAKHFPGLGDTTVNTDNGVAITNETRAQIMATDIPPFRAAIKAGVKSIMAAHIVAPALDPSGMPASLSEPIVTGLLRNTLGYDGVVVTDSLGAGALADIPPEEVALDAVNAGDDELLMPPKLPSAVQAVIGAVRDGTISTARIDRSVHRILRMKFQLGLFDNPYTTSAAVDSTVGTPAHLKTMAGIARRSVTLLDNADRVVPIAPASGKHVLVTGWGSTSTQTVAADLTAKGLTAQAYYNSAYLGANPSQAAIDAAVAAAKQNDVVVVTTDNAWGDVGQQRLVAALLGSGTPVVVAALGGPYDVAYLPGVSTSLAAYDYQPPSLTALVDTLVGVGPTGRLPVTVPRADGSGTLFPRGFGIGYRGR
jgi:beta-N-acetylhexosaminidase